MVVGCWGPRQQGRTSSSNYVTPVTATPVRDCTPDCLRKPAAGSHPSSGRGIPVSPFLKRARTQEGCKVTGVPAPRPRVYPRQPSPARSLSYRPSCRFYRSSSEAGLPRGRPTPPSTTTLPTLRLPLPARELRTRSTTAAATPASFSWRPSYVATAITFAGKSSEAVREPGLTLQGVVRGLGEPFFLVFYFFFSFSTFSFALARGGRFFRAIDKII